MEPFGNLSSRDIRDFIWHAVRSITAREVVSSAKHADMSE